MVPGQSVRNSVSAASGLDPVVRALDPADASQVGAGFLSYLRSRSRGGAPDYLEPPVQIFDGWETYTYRLQLQPACAPPWEYRGPITLRIYASPQGLPRAQAEFSIQGHMRRLSYPVPQPLLLEQECGLFGGPFLLLEHIPGRTLFAALLQQPWRLWAGPAEMAAFHRRLHNLPTADFPSPHGPLLSRYLEEMQGLICDHDLASLRPGIQWLCDHCPAPPESAAILHLDFHPLNLVCGPGSALLALDWTEADIGDVHADVATALMLMACCPLEPVTLWERLAVPVGRWLLCRRYLRGYRRLASLDEEKLSYYRALAAFRRLCRYGCWLRVGPEVTGSKPCSVRRLTPQHINTLENYFHKWTGIAIKLS